MYRLCDLCVFLLSFFLMLCIILRDFNHFYER